MKLNGTHQLLVEADDVNILSGRIHTIKKNVEVLVVASKEIRPEVNADKTMYMVMSGVHDAGWRHGVKTDNRFLWEGGKIQILGNKLNKSKLYSRRD